MTIIRHESLSVVLRGAAALSSSDTKEEEQAKKKNSAEEELRLVPVYVVKSETQVVPAGGAQTAKGLRNVSSGSARKWTR